MEIRESLWNHGECFHWGTYDCVFPHDLHVTAPFGAQDYDLHDVLW